ncbi:MAG: hypothetical protein U0521_10120 [Anaerolineae bacterium]
MAPNQLIVVLVLGYMFAPLFLIMPLMIASIIGADSIVGEKSARRSKPCSTRPPPTASCIWRRCCRRSCPRW